jgi:hypothetical protein
LVHYNPYRRLADGDGKVACQPHCMTTSKTRRSVTLWIKKCLFSVDSLPGYPRAMLGYPSYPTRLCLGELGLDFSAPSPNQCPCADPPSAPFLACRRPFSLPPPPLPSSLLPPHRRSLHPLSYTHIASQSFCSAFRWTVLHSFRTSLTFITCVFVFLFHFSLSGNPHGLYPFTKSPTQRLRKLDSRIS